MLREASECGGRRSVDILWWSRSPGDNLLHEDSPPLRTEIRAAAEQSDESVELPAQLPPRQLRRVLVFRALLIRGQSSSVVVLERVGRGAPGRGDGRSRAAVEVVHV